MKKNKRILMNLNGLLMVNQEVEKIYLELVDKVTDDELKYYFRTNSLKRKEFSEALKVEILNLGGSCNKVGIQASSELSKFWMNVRNFVLLNDGEENLINEVREMQSLAINKYNELLRMLGLPLSVCKLLVKQRDIIQDSKDVIERQELFAFAQ
ncbi:DUF2383 domain-containing protein [Tamlana sp. 2_MG-2023]|uniref:DUF2383 domain-containing protein n=1 Tax=unclassified Tamlana TaxID=2614803 RepID=UPI0026E49540|nr:MULTISPECIES: DUF2383 domain-containing protein [unclassified Tamlana]MDO6761456.1 DUF2383 domain-containing protein [Tamlana sp. 2_MG-2023]MDO6792100.1 DUF2383 domain-containing protein [Tamlana sp. 1_MG-2023]